MSKDEGFVDLLDFSEDTSGKARQNQRSKPSDRPESFRRGVLAPSKRIPSSANPSMSRDIPVSYGDDLFFKRAESLEVEMGGKWLQFFSLIIVSLAFFMLGLVRLERVPVNLQVGSIFVSGAILIVLGLYLAPKDRYVLYSRGLLFGGLKVLYSALLSARFNLDVIGNGELLVGWLALLAVHEVIALKVRSQLLASSAVVMGAMWFFLARDLTSLGERELILMFAGWSCLNVVLAHIKKWGTVAGVAVLAVGVWLLLNAMPEGLSWGEFATHPLSTGTLEIVALVAVIALLPVLYTFRDEGTILSHILGELPLTRTWDLVIIGQLLASGALIARNGLDDHLGLALTGWCLTGQLALYLHIREESSRDVVVPVGAFLALALSALLLPESSRMLFFVLALALAGVGIVAIPKRQTGIVVGVFLAAGGILGYASDALRLLPEMELELMAAVSAGLCLLLLLVICYRVLSDILLGTAELLLLAGICATFLLDRMVPFSAAGAVTAIGLAFTLAALARKSHHLALGMIMAPLGATLIVGYWLEEFALVPILGLGTAAIVSLSVYAREMDIFANLSQGRNEITLMLRRNNVLTPHNLLFALVVVGAAVSGFRASETWQHIFFPAVAGMMIVVHLVSRGERGRISFPILAAMPGCVLAILTPVAPETAMVFTVMLGIWLVRGEHPWDGNLILVFLAVLGVMAVGVNFQDLDHSDEMLWGILALAAGTFVATMGRQKQIFWGALVILVEAWLVAAATWSWNPTPLLLEGTSLVMMSVFAFLLPKTLRKGWANSVPTFFAISAYISAFAFLFSRDPDGYMAYHGWVTHWVVAAVAIAYNWYERTERAWAVELLLVIAPVPLVLVTPETWVVPWLIFANGLGIAALVVARDSKGDRTAFAIILASIAMLSYAMLFLLEAVDFSNLSHDFAGAASLGLLIAWFARYLPDPETIAPPWYLLTGVGLMLFMTTLALELWWALAAMVIGFTAYSFIREESANYALGLALIAGGSYIIATDLDYDGGLLVGVVLLVYLVITAINEWGWKGEPLTFITAAIASLAALTLPWAMGDSVQLTFVWTAFGGGSLCLGFYFMKRYLRYAGILYLFLGLIKVGYDYTVLGWEKTVLTLLAFGGFTLLASFLYFRTQEQITVKEGSV